MINWRMSTRARIIKELAERGFNADQEAVSLISSVADSGTIIERVVNETPESVLTLTGTHVESVIESTDQATPESERTAGAVPVETMGLSGEDGGAQFAPDISNDITGNSTGTGEYSDFVAVFRDRYQQLSRVLHSRVNSRPISAVNNMAGGADTEVIGMISDLRTTTNGHRLIELEDPSGTVSCLVTKDKELVNTADELIHDEVIGVTGRLADDAGVVFVDNIYFPDIPRTFKPATADRPVKAALISDIHVGSYEFQAEAWSRFADWLSTPDAQSIEYLLIAGDMVEGVGVYPGQDAELAEIDIFKQYESFSELLKEIPGRIEVVMIPGNHDAVRLAEPQPAFDDDLREILTAHDARVTGNPSTVTIEGVSILMYHGVSLDEIIAELPGASYDAPAEAMSVLLKKRHLAPQFGERTRLAPEREDYLTITEPPDVFHAGHVHKLGTSRYHNVTIVNSGCWQAQTAFQRRVNIDPDAGFAPILDLETLDITIRKFT